MSAKSKIRKGETQKVPFSRHVEIFLEMMAAERGASANTIEAYNRDLLNFGARPDNEFDPPSIVGKR